jgi:hypothetical protein
VKCIQNFSRRNLRRRDHLGDLRLDRIISKEIWREDVDLIHLAQDRVQCSAVQCSETSDSIKGGKFGYIIYI